MAYNGDNAPFPPVGWVTNHEAAWMLGVALTTLNCGGWKWRAMLRGAGRCVRHPELSAAELIGGPVSFRYSEVKRRAVEWLWPNRMARGKLTLIYGDPGKGKSFITVDMAARVSTGSPWPDGCGCAPKGSAILVSYEDEPDDTIGPRLDQAGADSDKVIGFTSIKRPADPADDEHIHRSSHLRPGRCRGEAAEPPHRDAGAECEGNGHGCDGCR